MKPRAALLLVALETVFLIAYYARAGTAIPPGEWLGSFTWEPNNAPFQWGYFAAMMLLSLASILTYAGWLAVCWSAGAAVLSKLGWEGRAPGQRTLVSIALGLGMLAVLVYFLGLLGLMKTPWVCAAGALMLAFGLRQLSRTRRLKQRVDLSGLSSLAGRFFQLEPVDAFVILILAAAVPLHLIGALLPPLSFDELNYQLSLPKLYTIRSGFADTPFNHLSFLPRNMSMLFTAGLLTGGAAVAKLFSWGMGLLAAASVFCFGRERVGSRAALYGAAVFFMAPVIGNQLRVAAADLGTAFFEITAVFLLLQFLESRQTKTLALAGALWGLALGCKYTAIPGLAAATMLLAWSLRSSPPKRILSALGIFLGTAVLLWSPWLLKNWHDTGNPVTPLLSKWLTSRNFFFAGRYRPMVDYTVGLGISNYFPIDSVRDFLLLPWRLTVMHNDFNHDLGPVYLMAAPLALLFSRRAPKWMLSVMVLACLYWAGWLMISVRMTRYFAAGMAVTSVVAGWLLAELVSRSPRGWSAALALPFLIALCQQGLRMAYIQNKYKRPWGYLAGRCSVSDYVYNMQPDSPYNVFAFANRRLPPDARVLVFNEYRTFYLERDFLSSTPWDHDYWHELVRLSGTPEELIRRMKERKITHLIANRNYVLHHTGVERVNADAWTPEELKRSQLFMNACFKPLYQDNGVWLGALKTS